MIFDFLIYCHLIISRKTSDNMKLFVGVVLLIFASSFSDCLRKNDLIAVVQVSISKIDIPFFVYARNN